MALAIPVEFLDALTNETWDCDSISGFVWAVKVGRSIWDNHVPERIHLSQHIALQKQLGWILSTTPQNPCGTLVEAIDNFVGRAPPQLPHSTEFDFREYVICILQNGTIRRQFESTLSPSQLSSHQAIIEWYCEPKVESFDTPRESNPQDSDLKWIIQPISEFDNIGGPIDGFNFDLDVNDLIETEFIRGEPTRSSHFRTWLVSRRRLVLELNSARRIAYLCHNSLYKSEEEQEELAKQFFLRQHTSNFRACSWLEKAKPEESMPYYLWDITKGETLETAKIFNETQVYPKYVAISHTWGRWVVRDEWATVAGVPWRVPRNTKFEVQGLPDSLRAMQRELYLRKLPVDYVWLDLLTIPQEGSNIIKDKEIGRQANIFQHAHHVIAWLNEIEEWPRLEAAVQWLCFNFVKGFDLDEEVQASVDILLQDVADRAKSPVELFGEHATASVTNSISESPVPYRTRRPYFLLKACGQMPPVVEFRTGKINPWFTSLWTLQELCLRPDMWLSNANWDLLAVSKFAPIGLQELVALTEGGRRATREDYPPAIFDLCHAFHETGLSDIRHGWSQGTILSLGNQRYCHERRAEAIMSAIGATQWFQTPEKRESDMVCRLYPMAFVHEVREALGHAEFFSSLPETRHLDNPVCDFVLDTYLFGYKHDAEIVGTLLPFGPYGGESYSLVHDPLAMVGHDTVKSWTIHQTGSVGITEVAILMFSPDDSPQNQEDRVQGPCSHCANWRGIENQTMDLQEWLASYLPEMPNYAVCTFTSAIFVQGIILKEILPMKAIESPEGSFQVPTELVKVGHFSRKFRKSDRISVRSCCWKVL